MACQSIPRITQKRESDFSYFHCGPFGTDLQVIVTQEKVISTTSYKHDKNLITILKLKTVLRALTSNKQIPISNLKCEI